MIGFYPWKSPIFSKNRWFWFSVCCLGICCQKIFCLGICCLLFCCQQMPCIWSTYSISPSKNFLNLLHSGHSLSNQTFTYQMNIWIIKIAGKFQKIRSYCWKINIAKLKCWWGNSGFITVSRISQKKLIYNVCIFYYSISTN